MSSANSTLGCDEWRRHACHLALHLDHAVDSSDIGLLPVDPGVYAIWDNRFRATGRPALIYVGKSEPQTVGDGIRKRVRGYLKRSRPNETLYLRIIDHIVRPDMTGTSDGVIDIATAYLESCRFAGWATDSTMPLGALERSAFDWGVSGFTPLINETGRRRRRGLLEPPANP